MPEEQQGAGHAWTISRLVSRVRDDAYHDNDKGAHRPADLHARPAQRGNEEARDDGV
jgi:hypothetical protein